MALLNSVSSETRNTLVHLICRNTTTTLDLLRAHDGFDSERRELQARQAGSSTLFLQMARFLRVRVTVEWTTTILFRK